MKKLIFIIQIILIISQSGCAQKNKKATMENDKIHYRALSTEERRVILNKGTEPAFSGKYDLLFDKGLYVCKQCGAPLYTSDDKFDSGCGWPAFDDEIPGAVKRAIDADGRRTEITCSNCGAHLGHVFLDEGLTAKNTRHCVNSVSLQFIPAKSKLEKGLEKAYFAGGCFWGVEYYLEQEPGVISVESGYMGGHTLNPSYEDVCSHTTGHAEVVQVTFDPAKINYELLAKLFFEIHDPTQVNRQGPDIGDQYRSEIFYCSVEQREIAQKLINQLKEKGYKVATILRPFDTFWKAEDYHQNYYERKHGTPYCHSKVDRFNDKK